MKLTKKLIDNTTAESKDQYLWDETVPGFGVKIASSGKKTFVIQYRNKYKQTRRVKIGDYGPWTLERARKQASKLRLEVDTGHDPAKEKRVARAVMTVGEMLDRYVEERLRANGRKSVDKTKREIDRYVKPRIGRLPLPELNHDVVQTLFNSFRGTPAIGNHVRSHLSAAFNHAKGKGYVGREATNPCAYVKPRKLKKHKRIIKRAEYAEIAEAMKQLWDEKPGYRPELLCIEFLSLTGCRIEEAKQLKWTEVDLANGRIVLEDHKTIETSDEDKVIPLGRAVQDVLKRAEELRKELGFISPYVFPHIEKKGRKRKKAYVDGSVRRVWDLIKERTNTTVKRKNLRSSYISRGAQKGFNVDLISKVVHHASPMTTWKYYLDVEEQQTWQAADEIARSIQEDME